MRHRFEDERYICEVTPENSTEVKSERWEAVTKVESLGKWPHEQREVHPAAECWEQAGTAAPEPPPEGTREPPTPISHEMGAAARG